MIKLPIDSKKPLAIIIIGAKASGKSTLVSLINGYLNSVGIRTQPASYIARDGIHKIITERDNNKILILEETI